MMQVVEPKMDAQQFCYWLQGFAELNNGTPPSDMQWKAIRDHLSLVFNKVTPSYPGLNPNWQIDVIKTPPASPYTITCSSGTTCNNSIASIC